ncbi:AIS_HP2_G0020380.mRNA.1.CDS.1 [Saccharomyces cerevisiae]|nr:AIS_HP2_G0020380.mRNA.1.CDS.1 [Saccharomyces cerevisiae]CAI6526945.1 AIS_HP2_G0020380.mRNA.1.CDS.1 [Saccharomyces cerevisiae]
MTDETAQPTQSAPRQESAAPKQTDDDQQVSQQQQQRGYNNYNDGSNYNQKKPYNSNRPHQQRGGKFGPNRYNSRGNYNGGGNYRGGHMGANGSNVPWTGYYNNYPVYYQPQQMGAGNAIPVNVAPADEKSSPVPTKIEITTKSGEHLDLKEQHKVKLQSKETSTAPTPLDPKSEEASDSAPTPTPTPATTDSKESSEENISEAEKTRRNFIEQVKLRKAALEKKRKEQLEGAGGSSNVSTETAPVKAEETEPVISEAGEKKPAELETNQDTPSEENGQEEQGQIKEESTTKALTFAERLKLKKQQKEQEKTEEKENQEKPVQEEANSVTKTATVPSTEQDKEQTETSETERSEVEESTPQTAEPTATIPGTLAESGEADDTEVKVESEAEVEADIETAADDEADDGTNTVSHILNVLKDATPIEDVFSFNYPEGIEGPDIKYKKEHVKYTYGPTFLLQFKDKLNVKADAEWVQSTASKIVIPPGMGRGNKSRDPSRFSNNSSRGHDFRSNSVRNMDDRANSRTSSKRRSKRMNDDRRSNRSYTSRRDRERGSYRNEDKRDDDRPREEVAPLVPSSNRWIPKSKAKSTEKKLAPDGKTELLDKDEVERKMKSLLNKLTLEMFDAISSEILAIANISVWETNGETLKAVIEQVFLKACDEPHWSSMYAQLCGKVVKELNPDISDETNEGKTGPKLVLHYLVARCHAEFDKGWTDKLPTKEDGTPLEPEMMSEEYYAAASAKRRGLGLVRFIGFLYRLNLLTGKMMFECFRRLMKDLTDSPSEETLESVIELLNTVGEQFETDSFRTGQATLEGSQLLDSLFGILDNVIQTAEMSSRIKFKLVDIKELRHDKNWNSDKKDDGPKTIQQIHEEEERQRQLKNNSRSNSRRTNNSSNRHSFRRDAPPASKDSFIATRTYSQRNTQRAPPPREEPSAPTSTATNMFSALMGESDDEE